jgi:hypothetical protein
MKLKVHDKEFNQYTQIDRFAVIPKKMWDEFELGAQTLSINDNNVTVRVYDVPCDCSGSMHSHRLIDLRAIWKDLGLQSNQDIDISRSSPKVRRSPNS